MIVPASFQYRTYVRLTGLIVPSGYFRVNGRGASKGDHPGNAKTTPGHHASTKGRLERGGVPRWSSVEITRSREIWLNVTPVTLTGARAKVIRTTVGDPSPMLDHFDGHLRRVIQKAKAHADRVLLVRQSWFGKSTYTPEETAHMWHGGAGQAWREEVTAYYSIDVTCELMALLDERAERVAEQLDVEQVDLPSLLEPSVRTYYDFVHLAPAGSYAVARAVAATLVREPFAARRTYGGAEILSYRRSARERAS